VSAQPLAAEAASLIESETKNEHRITPWRDSTFIFEQNKFHMSIAAGLKTGQRLG
jgi:hypothetical protein